MAFPAAYPRSTRPAFCRGGSIQRDVQAVLILDGIDILPDNSGFRIRRQDLHGPLPEIVVKYCGDAFQDKDLLANQVCRLVAIVRLRDQMTRFLPGRKLLPPTRAFRSQVCERTWSARRMLTPHGKHSHVSQSICFVRMETTQEEWFGLDN